MIGISDFILEYSVAKQKNCPKDAAFFWYVPKGNVYEFYSENDFSEDEHPAAKKVLALKPGEVFVNKGAAHDEYFLRLK